MQKQLITFDNHLIAFIRRHQEIIRRTALALVFFWFGLLKVLGTSPANPLVEALLGRTMPFISFDDFNLLFGSFEMIIGLLFIIPKAERIALAVLIPHLITTALPLILLPDITWQSTFVPTLEGQYILKNSIIIALAFSIGADLTPLGAKTSTKR
jgi:uncharacterized membrane protein YkgB